MSPFVATLAGAAKISFYGLNKFKCCGRAVEHEMSAEVRKWKCAIAGERNLGFGGRWRYERMILTDLFRFRNRLDNYEKSLYKL